MQVPSDGLNLLPVTGFAAVNGSTTAAASLQAQPKHTFTGQPGSYKNNPNTSLAVSKAYSRSSHTMGASNYESEEGFFDFMKSAVRVGAPLVGGVLQKGLPLVLGPLGGPIGALAGVALNAAGKLAESTDAESGFDIQSVQEGTLERAILAEAAFSAVQEMELHPEDEESIFSDMKDYIMKVAPTIQKVAPHVMGAMMEPALRIAMNSLHKYNEKGRSSSATLQILLGLIDLVIVIPRLSYQVYKRRFLKVRKLSMRNPKKDFSTSSRLELV